MGPNSDPIAGAQGWQISNPPVLSTAPLLASLEIFQRAGIARLREKSIALTGFLQQLDRGAAAGSGRDHHAARAGGARLPVELADRADRTPRPSAAMSASRRPGVIGDWREPDVLRLAPTPLYNSYQRRVRRGRSAGAAPCSRELHPSGRFASCGAGPTGALLAHPAAAPRHRGRVVRDAAPTRAALRRIRPLHQSGAGRPRHSRPASSPACSTDLENALLPMRGRLIHDPDGATSLAALRPAAERSHLFDLAAPAQPDPARDRRAPARGDHAFRTSVRSGRLRRGHGADPRSAPRPADQRADAAAAGHRRRGLVAAPAHERAAA